MADSSTQTLNDDDDDGGGGSNEYEYHGRRHNSYSYDQNFVTALPNVNGKNSVINGLVLPSLAEDGEQKIQQQRYFKQEQQQKQQPPPTFDDANSDESHQRRNQQQQQQQQQNPESRIPEFGTYFGYQKRQRKEFSDLPADDGFASGSSWSFHPDYPDTAESDTGSAYSLPASVMASMLQSPPPAPPPPPPPPPMPGSADAFAMPHWRDTYQTPIRESVPTKEQIEKQQYAHLPDKLLNAMNKDKKPFTYTPSGVSSEKGVLDLSEIRSPRMKKRLLANLHAGEDQEEESSNEQQSQPQTPPQPKPQPNPYQYQASPLVLPPIPADGANGLRSPSPNRKQLSMSPVPLPSSNDEELASVLQKRKQDVEARSTIVTNQPVEENPEPQFPQMKPPPVQSRNEEPQYSGYADMDRLCQDAANAVRAARGLAADMVDYVPKPESETMVNQISNGMNELNINDGNHPASTGMIPSRSLPPPPMKSSAANNFDSTVLKHVLDAGLQDEIDKFEQVSREASFSPRPSGNRGPPPPVPPKPQRSFGHQMDGRISCPPYTNYGTTDLDSDYGFNNSFRCISPAMDILKKTQNSGYNYVTKPRPFYRAIDENVADDSSAFCPVNQQSQQPVSHNERQIPIQYEDRNGYSASLPRKIKLNNNNNNNQTGRNARAYEDPEVGRQYLHNAGMFSQLPPRPESVAASTPSAASGGNGSPSIQSPNANKMFFGVNPRQANSNNNFNDNAQTYVDPEAGRQYLSNAAMFSQLPPPSHSNYGDHYNNRQSSLPPTNRTMTPGPEYPGGTPVNRLPPNRTRMSMSELRKLPPSERPHEPPPMKYTGGNIPSRTFRILQLITGEDIQNQFAEPEEEEKSTRAPPLPPRAESSQSSSRPWSQQSVRTNDSFEPRFEQIPQNVTQSTPYGAPGYSTSSFGTDF